MIGVENAREVSIRTRLYGMYFGRKKNCNVRSYKYLDMQVWVAAS